MQVNQGAVQGYSTRKKGLKIDLNGISKQCQNKDPEQWNKHRQFPDIGQQANDEQKEGEENQPF